MVGMIELNGRMRETRGEHCIDSICHESGHGTCTVNGI